MSPHKPAPRSSVRDYRGVQKGDGREAENAPAGQPGPSLPVLFTVPTNPRPKERPRVVDGHTYTPKETEQAEALVRAAARLAGARPHTQPVRLVVRAYRGDARRVDLDNLVKLVSDALNGTAYEDDHQIKALVATMDIDRENPRTEVEIHAIPPVVSRVMDAEGLKAAWVDEMGEGS